MSKFEKEKKDMSFRRSGRKIIRKIVKEKYEEREGAVVFIIYYFFLSFQSFFYVDLEMVVVLHFIY